MFIVLNRFQIVSLKYQKHQEFYNYYAHHRCELLSKLYL